MQLPVPEVPRRHALGLLFLWAEGTLTETGEINADVAAWGSQSTSVPPRPPATHAAELTPEEKAKRAAQAAERLAAREARVDDRMVELIRWLDDRLHDGLAALNSKGYGPFDALSRRMVDAQAPGVAALIQEVGSVVAASGTDWVDRTLSLLSSVRTLAVAWLHRAELPGDVAGFGG